MSNSTEAGIHQLGHLRGLLSNVTSLRAFIVSCPNASSLILQAYTSLEAFCRFVKESSILIILSMNFFGCRSLFSMKDECLRSIFRATLSGWRVWAEQAASVRLKAPAADFPWCCSLTFHDAGYGKHCPTLLTPTPCSLLSSFRNSAKHGVISQCSSIAPQSPFLVLRQLATLTTAIISQTYVVRMVLRGLPELLEVILFHVHSHQ